MNVLLFALIPPGSIQKEVGRLQEKLYARWGLVSALGLPVLIPLLFLPPGCSIPGKDEIRNTGTGSLYCTTGSLILAESHLFLEVKPASGLNSFARSLEGLVPEGKSRPSGPIPSFPGFYLAAPEGKIDLDRVRGSVNTPPVLRFPLSTLSLLCLEVSDRCWWKNLEWEEKITIRLKGS